MIDTNGMVAIISSNINFRMTISLAINTSFSCTLYNYMYVGIYGSSKNIKKKTP